MEIKIAEKGGPGGVLIHFLRKQRLRKLGSICHAPAIRDNPGLYALETVEITG